MLEVSQPFPIWVRDRHCRYPIPKIVQARFDHFRDSPAIQAQAINASRRSVVPGHVFAPAELGNHLLLHHVQRFVALHVLGIGDEHVLVKIGDLKLLAGAAVPDEIVHHLGIFALLAESSIDENFSAIGNRGIDGLLLRLMLAVDRRPESSLA